MPEASGRRKRDDNSLLREAAIAGSVKIRSRAGSATAPRPARSVEGRRVRDWRPLAWGGAQRVLRRAHRNPAPPSAFHHRPKNAGMSTRTDNPATSEAVDPLALPRASVVGV